MAVTFVHHSDGNAFPAPATFAVSPATVGNLLVFSIAQVPTNTGIISSLTGGGVTTWTKLLSDPGDGAAFGPAEVWYGVVTSAGSSNISISYTGTTSGTADISVQEFTSDLGTGTSWAPSNATSQRNASSTAVLYPPITTPSPDTECVVFGWAVVANSVTVTTAGAGSTGDAAAYGFTAAGDATAYIVSPTASTLETMSSLQGPAGKSCSFSVLFTASIVVVFPTTPILDILNRTENPLSNGGKWTIPVVPHDGTVAMKDDGSTAVSSVDGTFTNAFWNPFQFTDSEVYATVGFAGATQYNLYLRATNGGTQFVTTYGSFWATGSRVDIFRLDAGQTFVVLVSLADPTLSVSDQIGFSVYGSLLTVYKNGVSLGSASDSTLTYGNIGMGMQKGSAGAGLSNFGGGGILATPLAWYV